MASKSHPPSSKIKPIIKRYYQRSNLSQKEINQSIKSYSKIGKAFKFNQYLIRKPKIQVIHNIEEVLKSQGSLSRFDCFLASVWFQNAYFATKLKNLSALSTLHFQINEHAQCAYYLQRLLKSTTSLKNLTKIDYIFSCYSFKKFNMANRIFKSFRYFRKLTSLSLEMYLNSNHLPDQISALSSLTQLRHLKIDITSEPDSNDLNILIILASVLPKMACLEQIEVSLRNKAIRASHLLNLFTSFRAAQNLSHITLKLHDSHIINKSTIGILAEGLGYLNPSSIRKLDFHLSYNKRSQSLDKLTQALKKFTSLNVFHLNLCGNWKIENRADTVNLSSALSSLVSLSSLYLDFSSVITDGFFIRDNASAIQSLKNLNLLTLIFPKATKGTEEHIQQFFSDLKSLTCLQFLSLALEDQKYVDDSALETLAGSLKELTSLRKLALNFNTNEKVTNKGVISICNSLPKIPHLSSLTLNFTKNNEIDEEAVGKIFETLKSLPSLYRVIICLYECPKLNEKGKSFMNLFAEMIKARNFVEGEFEVYSCKLEERGSLDL